MSATVEGNLPLGSTGDMRCTSEDVRRAIRLMVRNRACSVGVFVALALGIGVSTATFSMVNYVQLETLPIPETNRVVRVTLTSPESQLDELSYADFADL